VHKLVNCQPCLGSVVCSPSVPHPHPKGTETCMHAGNASALTFCHPSRSPGGQRGAGQHWWLHSCVLCCRCSEVSGGAPAPLTHQACVTPRPPACMTSSNCSCGCLQQLQRIEGWLVMCRVHPFQNGTSQLYDGRSHCHVLSSAPEWEAKGCPMLRRQQVDQGVQPLQKDTPGLTGMGSYAVSSCAGTSGTLRLMVPQMLPSCGPVEPMLWRGCCPASKLTALDQLVLHAVLHQCHAKQLRPMLIQSFVSRRC
jgi:hypothetical protein